MQGASAITQLSPLGEIGVGSLFMSVGLLILFFRRALHRAPRTLLGRLLNRDPAPLEGSRTDRVNLAITYTITPVVFVLAGLAIFVKGFVDALA